MRAPVFDPRDRGEAMLGLAITRAMSADGTWAYTLYGRPGSKPFIHALDTERARAVCIDLPVLPGQDVFGARLVLGNGGDTLKVVRGGATLAVVNTQTFIVGSDGAAPTASRARRVSATPRSGSDSGPWLPLGVALSVVLGGAAVLGGRSRRARSAPGRRIGA
jgi:hypothetical protein